MTRHALKHWRERRIVYSGGGRLASVGDADACVYLYLELCVYILFPSYLNCVYIRIEAPMLSWRAIGTGLIRSRSLEGAMPEQGRCA